MTPLYPPWSDTLFRVGLVLAVLAAIGIPTVMILWARTPYVTFQGDPRDQPIAFDHRHHVRDDGIDCFYCHYEAQRSAYAGAPPTSVCMNCHSQIWQEATRLAPVRESWFDSRPIRWARVHRLPEFVYFDHSAHVTRGVGCVECHGRIDQMGRVYAVERLTMGWCLGCHRDPAPHVRPVDQVTNMEWEPARPRREVGAELCARLGIQPPVSCTGCHR